MVARFRRYLTNIRSALLILAVVVFIVFMLQNTHTMRVHFLLADIKIPIIVVLLVMALGGFVVGYLTAVRRRRALERDRAAGTVDKAAP